MAHSLNETHGKAQRHDQEDEETFAKAMRMLFGSVLPLTIRAAVELGLFDVIATAAHGGDAELSAAEIAARLSGCTNPDAPEMLERILRLLTSHDVLRCSVSHNGERLYGLTPVGKCFVPDEDEDGGSLAPLVLFSNDFNILQDWAYVKDAVLKGGIPFNMSHGMHVFEYLAMHQRLSDLFNKGMLHNTSVVLKKVLETYKGFDQVNRLVDVGGGVGIARNMVVSKYPHIHGINLDLHHVIQNAPTYPGVEHVAGDMFESVPTGDAIFMKWIIHDWDDQRCVTLLKNCHRATPETGKVIVIDVVVPEIPEASLAARDVAHLDMAMMIQTHGGKERTRQEFEALAVSSGFAGVRFVCRVYNYWVMEFSK